MSSPSDYSIIPIETDIPGVTAVAAVEGHEISKQDADRIRKLAADFVAETRPES